MAETFQPVGGLLPPFTDWLGAHYPLIVRRDANVRLVVDPFGQTFGLQCRDEQFCDFCSAVPWSLVAAGGSLADLSDQFLSWAASRFECDADRLVFADRAAAFFDGLPADAGAVDLVAVASAYFMADDDDDIPDLDGDF